MFSGEMFVFVHQVVPVRDLPPLLWLVLRRYEVVQVTPAQVGLKPHNVLYCLVVVIAKENRREVLILDVKFHGRLDECCDCNVVRLFRFIEEVED